MAVQRPKLATIMKSASGGDLSRPWQLSGYPPKRHLHDREGSGTASGTRSFMIMVSPNERVTAEASGLAISRQGMRLRIRGALFMITKGLGHAAH
jgi:hypothetical protein